MSDISFRQALNPSDTSIERKNRLARHSDTEEDGKTELLKFTLTLLAAAGCWRPLSWTCPRKRILYDAYTVLLSLVLCAFAITQIADIILNVSSAEEFTDVLYIMMAVCVSCYKILNMWVDRGGMTNILLALTGYLFTPVMIVEMKIRRNVEKTIRRKTFHCFILVVITCACIAVTSLFTDYRRGNLTYRAWLPFNYSSPMLFPLVHAHQMISLWICSMINLSCLCFFCGMLMHICCQIDMLEYRLRSGSHTRESLRDCVRHHDLIFNFATTLNERFASIIAVQFVASMLVVCANLYRLAKSTLSVEFFSLALYTFSMMIEIFLYCWFGNEVRFKSVQLTDRIFEMDWPALNNSFKKNLIMIMNRATIPIEFTSVHLFSMNLESFIGLLKISYSTYTLLQRI